MNKDEALKMAIEEIQDLMQHIKDRQPDMLFTGSEYVINACKEALATNKESSLVQPAQEPVAWTDEYKTYLEWDKESLCDKAVCKEHEAIALYTQPHQWQGLTDDEIQAIRIKTFDAVATNYEAYRAIEQALKEKNHG